MVLHCKPCCVSIWGLGAVRLDFEEKCGAKLCAVFSGILRFGTVLFFSVPYSYRRSNLKFLTCLLCNNQKSHNDPAQIAGAFSQLGLLVTSFRNVGQKPNLPTWKGKPSPRCSARAYCSANALFRAGRWVPVSAHRQQVPKATVLQLNIEGLTASKINVLHHLAVQYEALVILLQKNTAVVQIC